ncbi:unnamed protein product [Mytilus coruscus]|uniref:THAP-type domain-containing protein n=1 Tax=Mytilus coruscus TaxID=42192 RepID=A0A6J8F3V6_MYTCO|nr:unnamed protein product [Mytilus coruscus]
MPSTCCCVPNCSNRGGHVFPKNEKLKKKWIKAIKRNMDGNRYRLWKPSKTSVVCKLHFLPSDYKSETTCGKYCCPCKRLKSDAFPSVFHGSVLLLLMTGQYDRPNEVKQKALLTLIVLKAVRTCRQIFHVMMLMSVMKFITRQPCVDVEMTVPNESRNVPSIDSSLTQTLTWPSLCVEKFMFDSPGIMFYTGLQTYEDFTFVLATLGNAAYDLNYLYYRSEQLSVENQFFLTLIKLRQHKTNFELSRLFNISETAVVNIWVTWVNFMSRQWREVKTFPDRDIVRFFSPHDFKTKFPSTRIIIDGTECPVMKPKSPIAQQSTFSTYKNRNTIKLLVGATPGGLVNYVSPAYGGSTSDRQICERSNLSSICDKSDSIMADKGFNVQDLFAPYDVSINIPTFFRKKNRMTGKTVLKDRAISSKRVHIERIIGLAKTYKILKAPLNITETKLASEITFVCFMLCNFKTCIISETA